MPKGILDDGRLDVDARRFYSMLALAAGAIATIAGYLTLFNIGRALLIFALASAATGGLLYPTAGRVAIAIAELAVAALPLAVFAVQVM